MSLLHPSRRSFLVAALALAGTAITSLSSVPALAEAPDTAQWVIEPAQARDLLAAGALLIDTRGDDLKADAPLDGAVAAVWQDFTNPDLPTKGQLLDDDAALTAKLQALGVSGDVPVIAVADSVAGWGEDGRIAWTLRTLGHEQTYLVNGGVAALLADGPLTLAGVKTPGDFVVARTAAYEVRKEEIRDLIGRDDVVILDTREPREYAGETPYGESRGGHVPGARHIFYKDLVGADGRVLAGDVLKARLAELGVKEGTQIVSYCTGGIRSGFVTAVLNDLGLNARNYAGSMWEWSAQDPEQYPLVIN